VDRLALHGVGRVAGGKLDVPGRQERPDTVGAGLAVHVGQVVVAAERALLFALAPGSFGQEGIEHLAPRLGVHHRGVGDDAVQVEERRVERLRRG
jgi:hypothetical protein